MAGVRAQDRQLTEIASCGIARPTLQLPEICKGLHPDFVVASEEADAL